MGLDIYYVMNFIRKVRRKQSIKRKAIYLLKETP